MKNKQPPFQITNKIIDDVAEISELVGRLSAHDHLSSNPNLRRTNRIRTIHGSLAIEQNTLSLEQVTAVLNGKHVLAPPKDIAEVKNAYEIYERLDELDPYSVDDLLTAHGIMTRGLVEESGIFRTRPVGVVDQEGHVLHFGTLPQYVPDLVVELLDWAESSDLHMLIRSCVFHYELGTDPSLCRRQWPCWTPLAHVAALQMESRVCMVAGRIHHPRPSAGILRYYQYQQ